MALPYNIIARSKPFGFFIGPERSEFYIHSPILSHYSKPLDALMHIPMNESGEWCAWLKEMDSKTFTRLTEFLYTGDYPAAAHSIVITSESTKASVATSEQSSVDAGMTQAIDQTVPLVEVTPGPSVEEHDPWRAFSSSSTKKSKKRIHVTKSQQAWIQFETSWSGLSTKRASHMSRPNTEPCEDYTDVFLSHAKLYALADTYDIVELRALSLQKLHKSLCNFTLYQERTGDISRVLDYIYEDTSERDGNIDDMRLLIIQYTTCKFEGLMHDAKFKELMKGYSSISFDLLQQLCTRIE